ncbi:unnamed protein product [Ranitomeya imitator]|uniref:Helix-turn-helix domain-containing protein n=1 Tax=Ranitomeya imitator TaxID=111125 RepID=A0ABN9MCB3_9NEOB|nr:unnamed protein product [Ranitomeya imitator]
MVVKKNWNMSAVSFSYSETEVANIVSQVTASSDFLQVSGSEFKSRDLERETRHLVSLELHSITIAEYIKTQRIPRGLRVSLRPTLFQDNSDFCSRFEQILNQCSVDLMTLTLDQLNKEIKNSQDKVSSIETQLKDSLSKEEFDSVKTRTKENVDNFRKETEKRKRQKFIRDTQDYLQKRVYRWQNPSFRPNYRGYRYTDGSSASSSDNERMDFQRSFFRPRSEIQHTKRTRRGGQCFRDKSSHHEHEVSDTFYVQTQGSAMGSNVAPPYANCFMSVFESDYIYSNALFKSHCILWRRYIDDVFCLWRGTGESLQEFFGQINSVWPELSFTLKFDRTEINFLDTKVIQKSDGTLIIDLYVKDTDRNNLLLYQSCHPKAVKRSIPQSQFERVRRIVSDSTLCSQRLDEMEAKFLQRGYPHRILDQSRRNTGSDIPIQGFFTCNSKDVVYAIKCPCGKMYVGETTQAIKERISHHKSDIRCGKYHLPIPNHFREAELLTESHLVHLWWSIQVLHIAHSGDVTAVLCFPAGADTVSAGKLTAGDVTDIGIFDRFLEIVSIWTVDSVLLARYFFRMVYLYNAGTLKDVHLFCRKLVLKKLYHQTDTRLDATEQQTLVDLEDLLNEQQPETTVFVREFLTCDPQFLRSFSDLGLHRGEASIRTICGYDYTGFLTDRTRGSEEDLCSGGQYYINVN